MQVRTGLLELGTGPVIETSAHVSTEKKKNGKRHYQANFQMKKNKWPTDKKEMFSLTRKQNN